MNSKIYDAIPPELNVKLKNAKLNSQKNDVKFTTLLTPFSDSKPFLHFLFYDFKINNYIHQNIDFILCFWLFSYLSLQISSDSIFMTILFQKLIVIFLIFFL